MLPFSIGLILAIFIAMSAKVTRFDQDKSFYPTVLVLIASYYILFAVMHGEGLILEILISAAFFLAALVGAFYLPIVTGIALIIHGLFDLIYQSLINNEGVPLWWPHFCAGVDIALGVWVVFLTLQKRVT